MAHIMTYARKTDGDELSEAGAVIYDKYVAEGKLVMEISEDNVATLTFTDEATADAYIAEMKAAGEDQQSGDLRGTISRSNV